MFPLPHCSSYTLETSRLCVRSNGLVDFPFFFFLNLVVTFSFPSPLRINFFPHRPTPSPFLQRELCESGSPTPCLREILIVLLLLVFFFFFSKLRHIMQDLVKSTRDQSSSFAALSCFSDQSTVVDTSDVLRQYERLLSQLSQQAIDQQAEIVALRATLELQKGDEAIRKGLREEHGTSPHASTHRCHVRHCSLHRSPQEQETSKEHAASHERPATVSPPSSPQMSSIASVEEADVSSIQTLNDVASEADNFTDLNFAALSPAGCFSPTLRTHRAGDRGAVVLATPLRLPEKEMGKTLQHRLGGTRSVDISGASDGLSPSPVGHAAPPHTAAVAASAASSHASASVAEGLCLTSCTPSTTRNGDSVELLHRKTGERASNTTASRQTRHVSMPEELALDGQDAMDYLLSVFTSARCAKDMAKPAAPCTAAGVARQLLYEHNSDDDSWRAEGTTAQTWQQRYARIVAASARDDDDPCSMTLPDASSARHSASFSHNQSASELVEELIQFFTI